MMKRQLLLVLIALFVSSGMKCTEADENRLITSEAVIDSANAPVQSQGIPSWAVESFSANHLNARYDFAFALNPPALTADFNGDGKLDVAVLVKQRSTGKLGIEIVHGGSDKITILGAGTPIGNGGDDFAWMDTWQVYLKAVAAKQTNIPHVRGDALLVGKSESASALIYWNGKRYVWQQQGD